MRCTMRRISKEEAIAPLNVNESLFAVSGVFKNGSIWQDIKQNGVKTIFQLLYIESFLTDK